MCGRGGRVVVIILLVLLIVGGNAFYEAYRLSEPALFLGGVGLWSVAGLLIWWMNRKEAQDTRDFQSMIAASQQANPSAFLDITVRANKNKRLTVFPDRILFDGKTMRVEDVQAVWVENSVLSINGLDSATRSITLSDGTNKMVVDCSRNSAKLWHSLTYDAALTAIWSAVGPLMMKKMVDTLDSGAALHLGPLVDVIEEGVTVKPRRFVFWARPWKIEWRDVWAEMSRGKILIRDTKHNNMLLIAVKVARTENALPLFQIIDRFAGGNERVRRARQAAQQQTGTQHTGI